jgi:predicted ATPase
MKRRLPLRSFRLQNFKAVRDSGMVKFGPLTVFIGNNGSGKSSLIEGLETFRDIVLDGLDDAMRRWRGFEHVWNHAVQHELRQMADHRPHHTNPMAFRIDMRLQNYSIRARQELNLGEGGNELFIQHEQIIRRGQGTTDRTTRDAQGRQTVAMDHRHPALSVKPTDVAPKVEDGESILKDMVGGHLESWQFLALRADTMGQPVPQQRAAGRIRLAKNGANIAEYLNEIRRLNLEAFNGILQSLQYALPFAKDLQPFLASELQREFYLKLKEEEFEVPGWLLSTGTLRILALLACLRHPEPPPVLVIEEIENGLDPRTLQLLVAEIQEAITAGTTQVILTTHSPHLLDLLHLSHIVVVEREENEPKFRRPDDEKQLRAWAREFSPGQLYTMGRLTGSNRK